MKIAIDSLPREFRIAMLVVLVAGAGALAIHFGLRDVGIGLFVMAAAIAAAFYLLVWRPARIPRGAGHHRFQRDLTRVTWGGPAVPHPRWICEDTDR